MDGPSLLREKRRRRGGQAYGRGLWAEALCRFALRLKAYRLVASRYKTRSGEIDLIAVRGRTLAFVEVKARPDSLRAGEAISVKQQERLQRAAAVFLAHHPFFAAHHLRFDAMFVLPWRWPLHHCRAFDPWLFTGN